jgi:23S rRNA (adenine2503-C2)-methyltransferase
MDLQILYELIKNEPSFRLKQIKRALFFDVIEDWDQATTLPKSLRDDLKDKFPISIKAECHVSKDNSTTKALITLDDGEKVESVLMKHGDGRNTVCLSCEVGCPLGCEFCATGKMGFKRNLTYSEIIMQLLFFERLLKKEKGRVTNAVFMGMGEPFLNYDNVMESIRTMNSEECFNIGARHISISTAGLTDGIEKLSKEKLQVNLAISFHAPNDELRSRLMPINKKYPIGDIMAAVRKYANATKRKVMFEYVMISGVNDGEKEARELSKLMRHRLFLVNLISYNPTGLFSPSEGEAIKVFKDILLKNAVSVTQRYKFGVGIDAACGQLACKK